MENELTRGQATVRQERRDAVQNRERILVTARRLFAQQGVESTSMNQIAHVAEVGPGTLYRNFTHKGDLCFALLADDIATFQEHIAVLLVGPDAPQSALVRLELLLNELLTMFESHIPLLAGMREVAIGERRFNVHQSPFYSWMYSQFTQLLCAAVEQGEIPPLDVEFTADAISAAIAPPLIAFQQQHRGFSRERIVAGMRRLFIGG
ncbi:MAG: TetR/AcrR family transcriptional regulator [Oscillochloris sp.]|nr:TetR/AcrR family transcriptional regulator [Oscillochloris sp.]